jgi:MFS family permease
VVWRAVLRAVLPVTDGEGASVTAQILIATALLLGTPFFIIFGWLSDRIGRKPVIWQASLAVRDVLPVFRA